MIKDKNSIAKMIVLFCLLVLPWFNSNYFDSIKPEEVRQESVAFYEINPCKVSLAEFLISNPKYSYQDHYFLRFNDDSSIACFGRISGVTVLNDGFYISIGTNPLINLLLQGSFWIILFSFIKKGSSLIKFSRSKIHLSVLLTTYLYTFSIYAEQRFYSTKIFLLDLNEINSYILIFLILYFVIFNAVDLLIERFDKIIYHLPFTFLLIGIFSGYNFSIYSLVIVFFGIYSILSGRLLYKTNIFYLIISFIWLTNSTGRYYFEPGKLRGFTSSNYEFNSNLFWIIYFLLLINGLVFLIKNKSTNFNFEKFVNTWSMISIPLVLLGIVGANFPLFNFFNYYYFGQQKYGININNPFQINDWSEKVPWRGFYPSAEGAGEFYGLAIIFLIALLFKYKKLNIYQYIAFIFSLLGLYFTNNRAAMVLILLMVFYLGTKIIKLRRVYIFTGGALLTLIIAFIVGFENLFYPYEYTGTFLYGKSLDYKLYYETSSFLEYLNFNYENNTIFMKFFSFISFISFMLNRSELWGIFSARYNPTFGELMVGSGPLNFGQLYGEINVAETKSFLLPHSSLLSYILFFGLLGVLILLILILFQTIQRKKYIGELGFIVIFYVLINITKNDSLNYLSSFSVYFYLFSLAFEGKLRKSLLR